MAAAAALLVSALGLSLPTAAQALPGPSGPYTVSGKITFPASAPSNVRQARHQESTPGEQYPEYVGVDIDLYLPVPGTVQGWSLGEDGNVHYNASTGDWSVTGVGNANYQLSISVTLPHNGSARVPSKAIKVSGANVSAGTTAVNDNGRMTLVSVTCDYTVGAKKISAKNRSTGIVYPIVSGNRGWTGPHARCSQGADYGIYDISGNPPAGGYTVYFQQDGITEYYTGSEIGSLAAGDAATVVLKSWEGSQPQMMYGLAKPVVSTTPVVSGSMQAGATLKADAGKWTSGATKSYRWLRDGASISGATSTSYKLKSSDMGKKISFKVVGKKSGYWPAVRVTGAFLKSAKPSISGSREVGRTLKANPGSWAKGTKFGYQWYLGNTKISGATGASYKLTKSSAGHTIRVKVTGKKTGYTTVSRYSSKTGLIRK